MKAMKPDTVVQMRSRHYQDQDVDYGDIGYVLGQDSKRVCNTHCRFRVGPHLAMRHTEVWVKDEDINVIQQ